MGFCGVGAAGDDGVKSDFGTVAAIEKFNVEADIEFGSTGLDEAGDVFDAGVGEFACSFDALDFIARFDHAEVADEVGGVDPGELVEGFGALFPGTIAERAFEPNFFCAHRFEVASDAFIEGFGTFKNDDFEVVYFGFCLEGVATIGDQDRAFGGDEGDRS